MAAIASEAVVSPVTSSGSGHVRHRGTVQAAPGAVSCSIASRRSVKRGTIFRHTSRWTVEEATSHLSQSNAPSLCNVTIGRGRDAARGTRSRAVRSQRWIGLARLVTAAVVRREAERGIGAAA